MKGSAESWITDYEGDAPVRSEEEIRTSAEPYERLVVRMAREAARGEPLEPWVNGFDTRTGCKLLALAWELSLRYGNERVTRKVIRNGASTTRRSRR